MHALKTLAAAVAASLTLGACASSGAGGSLTPADAPARAQASPATVKVENRNWQDVVVYAVREGSGVRARLGMVTSMSTQTFRIPRHMLAAGDNIRLQVDPIGSTRGYVTEGILLRPGQQASFSVMNHLPMSTLSVLNR
ncbi:MAG TPA: hypothetical protein VF746_05415 [Longimicrobium sp.]|jgi:P pilus assembly chaperone PapD